MVSAQNATGAPGALELTYVGSGMLRLYNVVRSSDPGIFFPVDQFDEFLSGLENERAVTHLEKGGRRITAPGVDGSTILTHETSLAKFCETARRHGLSHFCDVPMPIS